MINEMIFLVLGMILYGITEMLKMIGAILLFMLLLFIALFGLVWIGFELFNNTGAIVGFIITIILWAIVIAAESRVSL